MSVISPSNNNKLNSIATIPVHCYATTRTFISLSTTNLLQGSPLFYHSCIVTGDSGFAGHLFGSIEYTLTELSILPAAKHTRWGWNARQL